MNKERIIHALRKFTSPIPDVVDIVRGKWRDENVSKEVQMEWDLHDRFWGLLKEHGQFFKPTWRQLFSEDRPRNSQHWKWEVSIPRNGQELSMSIWGFHHPNDFDIWIEFPSLRKRVGFAPRGKPTNPSSREDLEFSFKILEDIERRVNGKN